MASANVLNVTGANFKADVLSSTQPVLLDFWAEWCGPCKMLSPVIDELATEYVGKAKVGKVNIDEAGDLAGQFGIQSIPTLMVFKNGEVFEQVVGGRSKRDLKAMIDRAL